MNRFASHNPERYEQMIRDHGTIEEAFRADADLLRQTEKDRVVIHDDDREVCATCGELPANSTTWPGRCKRCERAIEDEREREW